MCIHMCVYIYIERERQRDVEVAQRDVALGVGEVAAVGEDVVAFCYSVLL